MNTTSTRLRQLADRMGLDGFAEELREIAVELEAKAAPAVPQGVIYEKADSLYKRGYTDRQTGKDYDPRGCDEWQEVVDWLTPAAPSQPVTLTESERVRCLIKAGCIGTVQMTYDSGPYEITRTSINADRLIEAIIAALREKEQAK